MAYSLFNTQSIQKALRDRDIPAHAIFHEEIGSTNAEARRQVEDGVWEGETARLIVAGYQSQGRGRRSNRWFAPPNDGLLMTWVQPLKVWEKAGGSLALVIALAVAETLETLYGLRTGIKWPNDVRIHRRKICGVLVETASGPNGVAALVGIGLNANQSIADFPGDLEATSTSVARECGHPVDRLEILGELVGRLEKTRLHLELLSVDTLARSIRRRSDLNGRWIRVDREGEPPAEGTAMGIDLDGALIVREAGGREFRCHSGTITEMSCGV